MQYNQKYRFSVSCNNLRIHERLKKGVTFHIPDFVIQVLSGFYVKTEN
jgi:hypothetical protein